MNNILIITLLIFISVIACSAKEPKYKPGNCITPTDKNYSWYGKYARVDAFTEVDGYSGKNYILTFPMYTSNSSIFNQDIESYTKLVDVNNCKQIIQA